MSLLKLAISFIFVSLLVGSEAHNAAQSPMVKIAQLIGQSSTFRHDLLANVGLSGKGGSLLKRGAYPSLQQTETCDGCLTAVDVLNLIGDFGITYEDIREDIIGICEELLGGEGVRGDILCPGFLDNNAQIILDIVTERSSASEEICLDLNLCDPVKVTSKVNSKVNHKDDLESHNSLSKVNDNSLKIVHLTDIHVERKYLQGSAVDCGLPVCCRGEAQGNGSAAAWGAFECNTPPRTVEAILRQVAALNPDFILYSGDHPPHAIWDESQQGQLDVSRYISQAMATNMPGLTVFPTIGNHELFPTNLYYLGSNDTKEFNHEFGSLWANLAGLEEEQLATIQEGGSYTKLIRPGLRLLAYNSNFGYTFNFYNLLPGTRNDLDNMLGFMETTLEQAEANGEKVLLLTHHPMNRRDNYVEYGQRITAIVDKYSDLIQLHVMGHTHQDEFILMTEGDSVSGVALTSSSVTPWEQKNPTVRVYYMDPEDFHLQDYDQYMLNLAQAVDDTEPELEKVYRCTEEYNMEDLSAESFKLLSDRFESDSALFDKYLDNRATRNDEPCDELCRCWELCDVSYSTFTRVRECYYNVCGDPGLE